MIAPWIALDIDDVLSMTTILWLRLLIDEFWCEEWLSAQELRDKYFYVQHVPYSSRKKDEIRSKIDYWINDPDFQISLKPVEWALRACEILEMSWIKISCYLSNRPIRVYDATAQRLYSNWFPEAPIILRPEGIAKQDWNQWKSNFLIKNKQIQWIVDDNPHLIEVLSSEYDWKVFLFETVKFKNPNKIEVHQCNSWYEVLDILWVNET